MLSKKFLTLYLKGLAMGAADVVPGVSGGTIAFITGIYEELINSLKSISVDKLKLLKDSGIAATWKAINGNFLLTLLLGIATSIFTLSSAISYLLENFSEITWSFFFGLIVASVFLLRKSIKSWNVSIVAHLILGILVAYGVSVVAPVKGSDSTLYLFMSGSVAICAMILPGISGAFILLLLGMYSQVISAVKSLEINAMIIFASGCAFGLISFSRFLSWMFEKFHNQTIALLTGFMIGSLNKVWPWKKTLETWEDHHGKLIPTVQENISPFNYTSAVGQDPYIITSIIMFAAAMIFVLKIEKMGETEN